MPVYKLYVLSVGGDVADWYDLVGCDDDAGAIAIGRAHAHNRPMELWEHDRLVRRFPAASSRPPREPRAAPARPEFAWASPP
jgi:hypothetical protein